MNCSNYRGIKLLIHTLKLWERIIDQRLRDIRSISDGHFGFKTWVETTNTILFTGTMCEKYRDGNKPLDMVLVALEKAHDTVPREVLWRCMRKRNIPDMYIRLVQAMYEGATREVPGGILGHQKSKSPGNVMNCPENQYFVLTPPHTTGGGEFHGSKFQKFAKFHELQKKCIHF